MAAAHAYRPSVRSSNLESFPEDRSRSAICRPALAPWSRLLLSDECGGEYAKKMPVERGVDFISRRVFHASPHIPLQTLAVFTLS